MKIIFGQGNPEPDYAKTRHNVGFAILNNLVDEYKSKWIEKPKFNSYISEISIGDDKVLCVKPNTFYNETGPAIRKLVDFYKLDPKSDLLVIHDDLALPFGTVRVREKGSDAGNNGVKSINSHIEPIYHRIRIGIYNELRDKMDDADFVLAKFSAQESKQLEKNIIPQVLDLVEQFCAGTIELTSHKVTE